MADKQVTSLPAASAASGTDIFHVVQGGNSRQMTLAQLLTYIQGSVSGTGDTTPGPFNFTDQNGVALSTVITSNSLTPTGFDTAAPISITGSTGASAQYEINGSGTWTSSAGTFTPGQSVRVRLTSSGSYSTAATATLTIGGVSDTWNVTTAANAGYDIILMVGDSYTVGVEDRDPVVDTTFPGSYQYRSYAGDPAYRTIDSNTVPYSEQIAPTSGHSYLSPGEYLAKNYASRTGRKCLVIPFGYNGSHLVGSGNIWAVGSSGHENAIAQANSAITAAQAAFPGSVFVGIFQWLGANDMGLGATRSAFYSALSAAIDDYRSRITGASGSWYSMGGILPEQISTGNTTKFPVEFALQDAHRNKTNVMYSPMPEGYNHGDNLHANLAGNRLMGGLIDTSLSDTTPCVINNGSTFQTYEAQPLRIELSSDKYASWFLTGADAAKFECFEEFFNYGTGATLSRYYKVIVRWVGGSTAPAYASPTDADANNSYEVVLNAKSSHGVITQKALSIQVNRAYGLVSVGAGTPTIARTSLNEFSSVSWVAPTTAGVPFQAPAMAFAAGLNLIYWSPNGAWTSTTGITVNGVQAVQVDPSTTELWAVTLAQGGNYSPWLFGTGSAQNGTLEVITLTNTAATPSAFDRTAPAGTSTPPIVGANLTCPTGGIIAGLGIMNTSDTLAAGTTLDAGPSTGKNWVGHRTTSGSIQINGTSGTHKIISIAYAKSP